MAGGGPFPLGRRWRTSPRHPGGAAARRRLVETLPDDQTAPWGRITAWTPGAHLTIAWHVEGDEENATEVSVTFTPVDTGTRVDLVHLGLTGGAAQASLARTTIASGWAVLLDRFVLIARSAVPA